MQTAESESEREKGEVKQSILNVNNKTRRGREREKV